MVESPLSSADIAEAESAGEYRGVEPWAVIGLILGCFSALAMLGSLWLFLPLLGTLTSGVALRRIAVDVSRTGRNVALAGLALSIFFGAVPAAESAANYALLARQADQVGLQWFEFLREGHPENALMLRFPPDYRQPFDEGIWVFYRNDLEAKKSLREFVKDPLVRNLLALGKRAQVRFYNTAGVRTDGTRAVVIYNYAVTYDDDDGEKKTFFVQMILERKPTERSHLNPWRVLGAGGNVDPHASVYPRP